MKMVQTIKKAGLYILTAVFWMAVVLTFVVGCFNTFVTSADAPQDDYEEYVHSKTP